MSECWQAEWTSYFSASGTATIATVATGARRMVRRGGRRDLSNQALSSQSQVALKDSSTTLPSAQPKFTIHPDDLDRLNIMFDKLDKNHDGNISRAEIIKAMRTKHEVTDPLFAFG